MPKIQDYINTKEIATYIGKLPPVDTLDESLFPRKKQIGMELKWIRGSRNKPIALRQSTFDVAVKPRALNATLKIDAKRMPFFKESVLINEEDRQMLLLALNSNNEALVMQLASQIFDNYTSLVDGADVQMKRMRCQLLQNGQINIVSEDGEIIVDYGVDVANKEVLAGDAKWSNPAADVVGDFERWQKVFTDKGMAKPSRAIMTGKTFGYIRANTAIIAEIKGINNVIITDQLVKNYLKEKLNITVAIVAGQCYNEAGILISLYEDDKVTLIPEGTLGNSVYGTTPEEADKIYGSGKLDTQIVRTGIAITAMCKEDPVTVETKVSQICMPSFERIDECFFAKVN
ncbi:major capsid protein [Clostridium tertium]|uniref:major capsid protein n=1 Tax=Clostridium tertium TaxID=1559 RepID=UPI001AE4DDCE|nr:major capsid protein [Clostridium tertium]MBP1869008.1 hypothetical protein [Clostridium tertium]